MKKLLSDDLWQEISRVAKNHTRIRAAISYVTARHLDLSSGDLLVCDASEEAIKGCLTSASLLRAFWQGGVEVYSFEGLHSKVAVIDDKALIGSANLSGNAGIATCEASLLTDDGQIVGPVQGFIESVKEAAKPVNESFLERIEALPVHRTAGWSRKTPRKIASRQSRVWFIGSVELSERVATAEESFVQEGTKEAETYLTDKAHEVEPIRWAGKSHFRSAAERGDLVVQAFTMKRGTRKVVEVYPPATILHRQDEVKWTRFYVEYPRDRDYYRWRDIKADFKSLGITDIKPGSIRQLTGRSLGILQLMR